MAFTSQDAYNGCGGYWWKPRTGAGSTLSSKKDAAAVEGTQSWDALRGKKQGEYVRNKKITAAVDTRTHEKLAAQSKQQAQWVREHASRRLATKMHASKANGWSGLYPKQPLNPHDSPSEPGRGAERTRNNIRRSRPELNQQDVSELELGANFGGPDAYSHRWGYDAAQIREEDEELNEIAAEGQQAFYLLVNGHEAGEVDDVNFEPQAQASPATSSNDAASFDGMADRDAWPLPGVHVGASSSPRPNSMANPVSDGPLLERTGSWEIIGGGGGGEVRDARADLWETGDFEDEVQGDDWLVITRNEDDDGECMTPTASNAMSYLSTVKRLAAPEAEAVAWKTANRKCARSERAAMRAARRATAMADADVNPDAGDGTNAAGLVASRRRREHYEARVHGDYESLKSLHDHVIRSRKSKQGMEARERRMAAKAKARAR